MPRQRPTQEQQQTAGSTNQPTSSQPLAPTDGANTQAEHARNGAAESQRDKAVATVPRERRAQNWLLVIFTGLIFLVNSAYAYYAHYQTAAMQSSIDEIRRTREVEDRAYVVVKAIQLSKIPNASGLAQIQVIYTNSGRTPALNAALIMNTKMRETPIPDDVSYDVPEGQGSKSVIAPLVDLNAMVGVIPVDEITQAPAVQEQSPKSRPTPQNSPTPQPAPVIPPNTVMPNRNQLYVYGIVEYDDIFGQHHQTKFCGFIASGQREFTNCANYNSFN